MDGEHPPLPSHLPAGERVALLQLAAEPQAVDDVGNEHSALVPRQVAWHSTVPLQADRPECGVPETKPHLPARSHASHWPEHSRLQQTPSTQKVLKQSAPKMQRPPRESFIGASSEAEASGRGRLLSGDATRSGPRESGPIAEVSPVAKSASGFSDPPPPESEAMPPLPPELVASVPPEPPTLPASSTPGAPPLPAWPRHSPSHLSVAQVVRFVGTSEQRLLAP